MYNICEFTTIFGRRLETLNGWQRSWCIVVVVWLLSCVTFTVDRFPEEQDEMSAIIGAVRLFAGEAEELETTKHECAQMVVERGYESARFCIESRRQAETFHSNHIAWATAKLKSEARNSLLPAQLSVIGHGIALWVLPSGGLYLLGIAISWVKRGF